jgi:hypothetical protein
MQFISLTQFTNHTTDWLVEESYNQDFRLPLPSSPLGIESNNQVHVWHAQQHASRPVSIGWTWLLTVSNDGEWGGKTPTMIKDIHLPMAPWRQCRLREVAR